MCKATQDCAAAGCLSTAYCRLGRCSLCCVCELCSNRVASHKEAMRYFAPPPPPPVPRPSAAVSSSSAGTGAGSAPSSAAVASSGSASNVIEHDVDGRFEDDIFTASSQRTVDGIVAAWREGGGVSTISVPAGASSALFVVPALGVRDPSSTFVEPLSGTQFPSSGSLERAVSESSFIRPSHTGRSRQACVYPFQPPCAGWTHSLSRHYSTHHSPCGRQLYYARYMRLLHCID